MSKYRKKPVVIDAFVFAESSEPAPWFSKACVNGNVIVERNCMAEYGERLRCKIKTLEGVMTANEGDYWKEKNACSGGYSMPAFCKVLFERFADKICVLY